MLELDVGHLPQIDRSVLSGMNPHPGSRLVHTTLLPPVRCCPPLPVPPSDAAPRADDPSIRARSSAGASPPQWRWSSMTIDGGDALLDQGPLARQRHHCADRRGTMKSGGVTVRGGTSVAASHPCCSCRGRPTSRSRRRGRRQPTVRCGARGSRRGWCGFRGHLISWRGRIWPARTSTSTAGAPVRDQLHGWDGGYAGQGERPAAAHGPRTRGTTSPDWADEWRIHVTWLCCE
jgi:hypothetical protein